MSKFHINNCGTNQAAYFISFWEFDKVKVQNMYIWSRNLQARSADPDLLKSYVVGSPLPLGTRV
ncbi:hypothetical protein BHM03_00009351 [Ensete ventricosum]|nr:hypothetical protein BHM03_00009351 [Ensete ventricosum]